MYFGEMFKDAILTNAHNELLTSLVNIGILGSIAYYGIFVSFMIRARKYYRYDKRILYIALILVCFLGYNILNYQQILNYPFAFIMLGIGENLIKTID